MSDPLIDPSALLESVRHKLAELPHDEHLAALHAIDHGNIRIDLTDPSTVQVVLGERWTIEVPLSGGERR